MQHTTNYQLNQYEADDRVTREALNADNAKIDSALAGAGGFQIIASGVLDAEARSLVIPMLEIDLSPYELVSLTFHPEFASDATNTTYYMQRNNSSFITDMSGNTHMLFHVAHLSGDDCAYIVYCGSKPTLSRMGTAFTNTTQFSFTAGTGMLQPGTSYTLRGLR